MLPYVHVSDLTIFGLHLHPFGLLVVVAILVGTTLARRRARQKGLDLAQLESFIGWMLFVGFLSAHALDAILYHPREVLARPWSLLFFWEGIGSFSGFLGALVGVVMWRHFEWRPWLELGPLEISRIARREKSRAILPFADVILSVFPVAWIFGRAGCSIAHDHPGARAEETAPLAVAFPSPNPSVIEGPGQHATFGPITIIHGHFARYDLGTLELFLTIGIAIAFVLLWRRRLITGFYVVLVSLLYAPTRFAMDFLRIESGPGGDARYGGLTPAQWMCIALFASAIFLIRYILRSRKVNLST
jgi:phosphatidylglycerol:prolipoprotein diacylglycerol transferase